MKEKRPPSGLTASARHQTLTKTMEPDPGES